MKYPTQYRQIFYSTINFSETSYQLLPFSRKQTNKDLLKSIEAFGILQPPLLLEDSPENFIILSGRHRLQLLEHSEETKITALVLNSSYHDQPGILYRLLLQHQLLGNPLSVIEQAVFFKKAGNVLPEEELMQFLPMLGYKKKPHIPEELISLLQLDPVALQELHNNQLTPRSGKKLLAFNSADQQVLIQVITTFQLGGSKQQKFIDLIFELRKRVNRSVQYLINSWQKTEQDKQGNGPQRTASLLHWLQQQCRPRSAAAENEFQTFRRRLRLPTDVRLSHTPFFENDHLSLLLNFNSRQELQRKWPQLKKILEQGS